MSLTLKIQQLGKVKLIKSFSVYVFATFFNRGVNFLLLPVFTHYLSPTDYGILSLVNTTISILSIFIMVGTDGSIRKQYYVLEDAAYARFFSSAVVINLISFVLVSLLMFLTAPLIAGWLEMPVKWLLIAPLISFLSVLPSILQGQNRVQKRASAYALFTNSMTLTNLLLGLLFVAVFHWGYVGRIYSLVSVNFIFTLIAVYLLNKQNLFTKDVSKENMRFSLSYGLPVIPHLASAFVLAYSDRIFIANMVNVNELGIYNVGYTLGTVISFLVEAFSLAYLPFLFENLKAGRQSNHVKIVRTTYLFTAVLFASLLALVIATPFIYEHFINKRFAAGSKYVFWIGLGSVFLGMYKLVTGFIFYHNKTKYLTYLGIINIVINVVLNYFLIGRYGAMGAAYATMISFFLMFVFTFLISNSIIKMPWLFFLKGKKNVSGLEA